MYKRLDERRLNCEWLAQACTLPSPCVVSSQAFSVNACQKFEKWKGESAGEGKERKKVELADLLSFG